MRIVETPKHILENTPDLDPFTEKKQNLVDFFDMLFQMQDRELGESRDILSMGIEQTYEEAGITKNPETHSNESPTIRDLIEVLRDMEDNPLEYVEVNSEDSKLVERMEDESSRLIFALNEFEEGGQYGNLGKKSSLDLQNEDVVYFNLQQQEGSGSLGLMMHLLLSEVYERAKETDKKVLFCIDEAHYIMSDARSLDFLEQAVRHSRHYDMGINFITQTLEEFFQHNQSEAIAQQCSMRRIHKIESGLTENIMDTLSLNASHVSYIQQAEPGSEETGYSEALYGTDEHGYVPVRIYPSEFELKSINQAEEQLEDDE
jgi:type IV secretory pathway VirB4 component